MTKICKTAILMATYNGERHLREQLDSLFLQTNQDWHLFVHDDGSTDATVSIVQDYVKRHPDMVTLLNYPPQGGACHNFISMLETVDAPYYMFSDQDDVWMPSKIAKTAERMNALESLYPDTPIIVHTDLCITNESIDITDNSFIRNQRIKIEKIKRFEDYAATNTVTGCTMIFNKRAKQCMKRPYEKAILHDAWLCLSVSAAGGIIDFMDEPLVMYRQHGDNTLGAKDMEQQTPLHKLRHIGKQVNDNIRHYREMNAVRPLSIIEFIKAKIRYNHS